MQNTNSTTATLAETARAMKQWRAQKKSANEKMPPKLRAQIIEMLAKYQHSTVAQALRLSNSTIFSLRQRQNNNLPKVAVTPPPKQADVDFIPFQLHSSIVPNPPNEPTVATCEIIHPNGAKLIINNHDVNGIIKAFLCSK